MKTPTFSPQERQGIRSMDLYWREVERRPEPIRSQILSRELFQLMDHLPAEKILASVFQAQQLDTANSRENIA